MWLHHRENKLEGKELGGYTYYHIWQVWLHHRENKLEGKELDGGYTYYHIWQVWLHHRENKLEGKKLDAEASPRRRRSRELKYPPCEAAGTTNSNPKPQP